VDLEPRQVTFGSVIRGEGATRVVRLAGRDAAKTKLLSATVQGLRADRTRSGTQSRVVRAQLAEGAEAGVVKMTVAPDAQAGQFLGELVVTTDHPGAPELRVRVIGSVRGSVVFRPEHLFFKNVVEGMGQSRTLFVESANDQPIEVHGISVDHPALEASFERIADGRTQVTVTCDGKIQRDRESATLTIRTSSPEDPRIEVPVEIYRLKRQAAPPTSKTER